MTERDTAPWTPPATADGQGATFDRARLEIELPLADADPVTLKDGHYYKCGQVLPAKLHLTYTWNPATASWRADWLLRGRKLLKSGRWSDHVTAYLWARHVDQTPAWITDTLAAYHPAPLATTPAPPQGAHQ